MGKFKVVITDREYETIDNELRILGEIDADVYDYQCRNEDDVIRVTRDCDAIIIQYAKITKKVIEALDNCRIIAKYATGIDGIAIAEATKRGIYVTNVNEYCSDEVSTHAIALLLQLQRRIKEFDMWTDGGNWFQMGSSVSSLKKSVVGVISFGSIARKYVSKLKPFCDEIWVYDKFVSNEEILKYNVKPKKFEEIVAHADFISIHAPLTDETKHMFNREVFKTMKPTASLINVARGGLVCEADLLQALQEGEIASAALDVLETEPPRPENPLLHMKNVIVTPHTAWYSTESQKKLQSTVAEDVVRVLSGKMPENLVNKELAEK